MRYLKLVVESCVAVKRPLASVLAWEAVTPEGMSGVEAPPPVSPTVAAMSKRLVPPIPEMFPPLIIFPYQYRQFIWKVVPKSTIKIRFFPLVKQAKKMIDPPETQGKS